MAIAAAPLCRNSNFAPTAEVIGGQGFLGFEDLLKRALRHHFAPANPRARPQIDDMIGLANGVFIMLYHDHRIAQIPQALKRFQKPVIVPLMQANRGLIQHIENTGQPAANLAREPDPLGFAARQGSARAVEVQVIQPDIVKKAQPLVDFFENWASNLPLLFIQMLIEIEEPCFGISHTHDGGLSNIGWPLRARDFDTQRFLIETFAAAVFARLRGLKLAQLLAHPRAVGLHQTPVEIADYPFKGFAHGIMFAPILKGQLDRHSARPMQNDQLLIGLQLIPRRVEIEIISLTEAGEDLHIIRRWRVGFGPWSNRALLKRQPLVRDNQLRVEQLLLADPITRRAGPLRRVEREQAWLNLFDRESGYRAGKFLAEDDPVRGDASTLHLPALHLASFGCAAARFVLAAIRSFGDIAIGKIKISETICQFQRRLKTVGQPRLNPGFDRNPVDHHLDVVFEFLIKRGRLFDRIDLAINPDAGEASLLPFGKFLAIFTLAPAYDRGQQIPSGTLGQFHDPVDHLTDRLSGNRLSRGGRVRHPNPRPQQPHVVIDFRDRRNG